jgi:hypothetical protein
MDAMRTRYAPHLAGFCQIACRAPRLEKGKNKMKRRDSFQRKAYAIHRMSSAAQRLMRATSAADKENARGWMARWRAVSGIRQFKLGNGGGRTKKGSVR